MADDNNKKFQDRRDLQAQINEGLRDQNNLTNAYSKILQEQLNSSKVINKNIKDRTSLLETIIKNGNKNLSLDDRINNLKSKSSEIEEKLNKSRTKAGKLQKGFNPTLIKQLNLDKELLDTEVEKLGVQQSVNEALNNADDVLLGGMGKSTKDLVGSFGKVGMKAKLVGGALTAAVAILVSFSGKLDTIGQQFGAIGINSSAIRGDLLGAEQEAIKLGKSLEDVITSVTTLTSEFGTSFSEARGLASSVVDTSVALGLGVSEAAQLIGTFSTISGLSNDTATALAKQTTLLALSNDVAPQQVLKDIAGSTEVVAKFTDASGENIARGAIQARRLGIDLNTAANAAEGLLDFNNAVQKSLEASVLVGREINVRRLQELSLAGDLAGVAEEQRRILGSQSEFLGLNVIQRKALAESIGLSVDQAAKLLDKEKEAVSLAGQLAGQPGFDELVGEKGISTLTRLTGSLKSLGAVLTNSLGPILNLVLKLLVGVGKVLEFVLTPFNALFRGINEGIDNTFITPTAPNMPSLQTEGKIKKSGIAEVHAGESVGVFNEQIIVDAINNLKLSVNVTNKQLQVALDGSNG